LAKAAHIRLPILGGLHTTAAMNAGTVALGAITGVLIARELGPTARGELVIASVGPPLIASLLLLGTDEALVFILAHAKGRSEVGRVVGSAIGMSLTLGAIATVLSLLLQWLYFAPAAPHVAAIAIYGYGTVPFLYIFTQVSLGIMRARQQYTLWNLCRGWIPLCYLASVIVLIIAHRLSPTAILTVLFAANLLLFMYSVLRLRGERDRQFLPKQGRDILRLGTQNHLITVGQLVNQRLDQFVLARLVSSTQLGYYAVAVTYASLGLVVAMAPAWQLYSQGSQGGGISKHHFSSLQWRTTVAMAAMAAVCGVLAPFLMPYVFGRAFTASVLPAVILLCGAPALALSALRAAAWKASGKPLRAAFAEGIGIVVTFVGLIVFARRFGIVSAAITSVLAYTTVTAVLFLFRTPPVISDEHGAQAVAFESQ